MTNALEELSQPAVAGNGQRAATENGVVAPAPTAKSRPHTVALVPGAASVALAIHFFISRHQVSASHNYWVFLFIVLGAGTMKRKTKNRGQVVHALAHSGEKW